MSPERDPLSRLLKQWNTSLAIEGQVASWQKIPARQAQVSDFPLGLDAALKEALNAEGIFSLYNHQVETWDLVQAGKNVVITTSTASGKSLAYSLPILNLLISDPDATALMIFPTKALANDQVKTVRGILQKLPPLNDHKDKALSNEALIAVYDGDTPSFQRQTIRQQARILVTNPDMFHLGILPHHTKWSDFFSNLRFVVLDEIHTYRGVWGSHVANVLSRLSRVAAFYQSYPQFIMTSATIDNPQELGEKLIHGKMELVEEDGSPCGEKNFILYNPPIVNEELGIRKGIMLETTRIANEAVHCGVQVLVFGRTRKIVELMLKEIRLTNPSFANAIFAYRSGYLAHDRRDVEKKLKEGTARAVVATNALELGVDIGGIEAVILAGYPGTIASTRQQAGRAGRKQNQSLAVLVASPAPIDQYLIRHPEYLFERDPEKALIDPQNPVILLQHLQCAAFELPFRQGEKYGNLNWLELQEYLDFLVESGALIRKGERYYWLADQYPASTVSLRSTTEGTILLRLTTADGARTIGDVDARSSVWMVHPGAIYLQDGQTYLVDELNLQEKYATLQESNVDYYTDVMKDFKAERLDLVRSQPVPGGIKNIGEVLITSQVMAYRKIHYLTREILSIEPLLMPPDQLRTVAYWVTINDDTVDLLREDGLWQGDKNDYGANWPVQRQRALDRDHYTCQNCGLVGSKTPLHVHHKIPFRQFPGWLQANQMDNLITLCPTCHRKAETLIKMRSGIYGLGYALSQLAPLFVMCDASDLGCIPEVKSDVADGKPAVILFDQVPAGIGLSQALFQQHNQLMAAALELVSNCGCTDGCPSCIGPAGPEGRGGKKETLALLKSLNGMPVKSGQDNGITF